LAGAAEQEKFNQNITAVSSQNTPNISFAKNIEEQKTYSRNNSAAKLAALELKIVPE